MVFFQYLNIDRKLELGIQKLDARTGSVSSI
jgi:hypothetical protein